MSFLDYQNYYLIGIKGVAMTALAQCLTDAGKKVSGSDIAEDFVTAKILALSSIKVDVGFDGELPKSAKCVVYTAAHRAQQNPQVVAALQKGLPTYSHAAALGELFNQKRGIAVCGVGGKSTTSAMIAWILNQTGKEPSFAIGVGNIPGLERTGQWREKSEYFVAEADEYVVDPSAPSRGEKIVPRFSFLNPFITVCTNLKFDHPDVYENFTQTKEVYEEFFAGTKEGGTLIVNGDNSDLNDIAKKVVAKRKLQLLRFGKNTEVDIQLHEFESTNGKTTSQFSFQGKSYDLTLQIPGEYNVLNALAAILACFVVGVEITDGIKALSEFRSTMRRSEFIGEKNGVRFYDDYAHHPDEVRQVIHAYKEWFPQSRLIVAFQSHTFSRTKALFNEFVEAFAEASEVTMIDIFPSAREVADPSVSSDLLCKKIHERFPQIPAQNFKTIEPLAEHYKKDLRPGDIFLTVGAGDIYLVHGLL